MRYDELQAALAIAKVQAENRELREQLRQALERALRPAVIARKLSCGNKTETGRRVWQILSSLGATCDRLALDFTDFLAARLPLAVQVR